MPTASKGLHGLDAHQPLPSVQVARALSVRFMLDVRMRLLYSMPATRALWRCPLEAPFKGSPFGALNMQRIGESKWRPLELCYWPGQGALPAKGKEYPSLGYKRLRDKPPKTRPAVAQ
ncbi:hypothetical protein QJQ45_000835 [Haematococcus lacustris]|nr:hypothetical protein QJQ45_000835 [Haematococcus lacustris]